MFLQYALNYFEPLIRYKNMIRLLVFCIFLFLPFQNVCSQNSNRFTLNKYPPCYDSFTGRFQLRNEKAPLIRKIVRGSMWVFGMEAAGVAILAAVPSHISNWHPKEANVPLNYRRAWTMVPNIDKDPWFINYIGHPYQGTYMYNALRSQGATFTHSAMFCVGHVLLWEYFIEASMERPSLQDLVVTPVAGILVGELIHFGTMRMLRNGFKWYEKALVTVINPMFILNNGYKIERRKCNSF